MALQLKFTVENGDDCKSIIFTETTGKYLASTTRYVNISQTVTQAPDVSHPKNLQVDIVNSHTNALQLTIPGDTITLRYYHDQVTSTYTEFKYITSEGDTYNDVIWFLYAKISDYLALNTGSVMQTDVSVSLIFGDNFSQNHLLFYGNTNNLNYKVTLTWDNTGSQVVNLTGYGAPNPTIEDVTSATLVVQNLTTSVTYDAITIIPSDSNATTIITTEDLEISGVSIGDITLPDGLYKFTYTVIMDDETVYEQEVKSIFLCESCCKIKQLASEVDVDCGCCTDDCAENLWKFLEAHTIYQSIIWSGACGSETKINKNIENLQEFLINIDCKNC